MQHKQLIDVLENAGRGTMSCSRAHAALEGKCTRDSWLHLNEVRAAALLARTSSLESTHTPRLHCTGVILATSVCRMRRFLSFSWCGCRMLLVRQCVLMCGQGG
jgi:hypothetical protein